MEIKKTYIQIRLEKKRYEIISSLYKKWINELKKISKLTENKVHVDTIKVSGNIIIKNLNTITDESISEIKKTNIALIENVINLSESYSKKIESKMIHFLVIKIWFDEIFKGLKEGMNK